MFTQPCFIRKNTPELRKKLDELGYKFSGADHIELDCIVTFPHNDTFSVFAAYHFNIYDDNFKTVWKGYIDCGTNEELFLALAALRDDSDYMQWFTDGKLWEKSNNDLPSHYMQLEGNKATVEEIIGTAKTTNENNLLLISFRHPIYSQYKILFVDDDYQYALVGGSSENYLWILSRTPNLDKTILDKLINIAKEEKYNVNKIVLTEQN